MEIALATRTRASLPCELSCHDRGRGDHCDDDKRSNDTVPVDAAVDAAARSARRRQQARDGGAATADVVARAGGIYRRDGVTILWKLLSPSRSCLPHLSS